MTSLRFPFSLRFIVGVALTAALAGSGAWAQWPGNVSDAPIDNIIVNDRTADTTANDTQSTTALLRSANNVMIAAFNDSGSGANKRTGWARSAHNGATWTDMGALPDTAAGDAGFPRLVRDSNSGRIYLTTRMATGTGIHVFRSDDNGLSFQSPVNGLPGLASATFQYRHARHALAIDNFAGAGHGNLYLAMPVAGGIRLTRSVDGGQTWGPNGGLILTAGAENGVEIAVGSDHAVHVFYFRRYLNFENPAELSVVKSVDFGASFGPPVEFGSSNSTRDNGDLGLPGGVASHSFPSVVVNPVTGALYAVFSEQPGVLMLSRSNDSGATWLRTQLYEGTGSVMFFPTITITPDGTKLFIAWYDRRRDPANLSQDYFGRIGTITGDTISWSPSFTITTGIFPTVVGQDPGVPSNYMGDYDQAVAANDYFYVTWGDNRLSSSAHAAQPDVLFARIPATGPDGVLTYESSTVSGGNGGAILEPDECADYTVRIGNFGTTAVTGVVATLSSPTPGVTIAQAVSAYPDLAVGATTVNTTAFRVSADGAFVCGTDIDFVLDVTTTNAGNFQLTWTYLQPSTPCDAGGGSCSAGGFGKLSPMHTAVVQTTAPTLSWQTSAGASAYEYCLDMSANDTCDSSWIAVGNTTSVTLTGLVPSTTYVWQLRNDSGLLANGSDWWQFRTGDVAFGKTAPANGEPQAPVAPTVLSWGISTGVAAYEYCVDSSINSACDDAWINVGSATSASIADLDVRTLYEWQVRTVGAIYANSGGWWTFTTGVNFFGKLTPADGQTNLATELPTFRWGYGGESGPFELCFDTIDNDVCDTNWFGPFTSPISIGDGLGFATTYYWQIRTTGTHVEADSGIWWTLTTRSPTGGVLSDFDRNNTADLLWQYPSGAVATWLMNGRTFSGDARTLYGGATEWRLVGTTNLNGDNSQDLLWQHPAGPVAVWFMNCTMFTGDARTLYGSDTTWRVVGSADFNVDGNVDLLWQNPAGHLVVWVMKGTLMTSAPVLYELDTPWRVVAVNHFNRDLYPDLLMQDPTGRVAIWHVQLGSTNRSMNLLYDQSTEWRVRMAADFDHDGWVDVVWQHPTGTVSIWLMRYVFLLDAFTFYPYATEWKLAVPQ